ncbi:hypothetical protein [Streptomyces sp. BE133]|uniref:hypothetical protein n=1 Tax=Streptomyces sp. BE133 TaxID=3002523 RepID=UPI002E768541|nr:hypothetical protein [Streptomyces sp. BE133]MEE1811244.1 hypothetical protein [Streptomyces sp. BE133]
MPQVPWSSVGEIEGCSNAVQLRWRLFSNVREALVEPPEPAYVDQGEHVPAPCVLHPEQVREYPPDHILDKEQAKCLDAWAEKRSVDYRADLPVAPGWKLSGWPSHFTFRDPTDSAELHCGECGGPVKALLTVNSSEWDGASGGWRPAEDGEKAAGHPHRNAHTPTLVTVGRGYTLQFYSCVSTPPHLPQTITQ